MPKRIESPRILLRQFDIHDAEEFYALESASMKIHLAPFSPMKEPVETIAEGVQATRKMMRASFERWDDGFDYRFAVTLQAGGAIIGQTGISNIIRGVSQSAFIGYWIGSDYLNNGYATECVVLAMHYAFEFLHLHRISLWIAIENSASLRVAEKLKLRFEGTAIQALHLGGRWQDTHIYAITSEEWAIQKNDFYSFLQVA
ncbi:MAG: GNAT family protein [bacterium]